MRYQFLLAAVALAGCHSYEMKSPEDFDAEPVALSGELSELRIGDDRISRFGRSWTKGSGLQIMSVRSEKRGQRYEFRLTGADQSTHDARCEFKANQRSVGMRGGWEIMAGEGASLTCTIQPSNGDSSVLKVATTGTHVLRGEYKAGRTYRLQGIGMAAFTGGKRGPAAGFYLIHDEQTLALVQVVSPRRVLFARGLDSGQRAELTPAIAALLLLDESVRDF